MASIVKKKYVGKKKTTTRYYISYRDIYGKQHLTGGYSKLQDAQKHINDFEDACGSESEITLKTIFDIYFKKVNKYAKTTQDLYNMYYDKYFKPIEEVKYKRLTSTYLQDVFDKIEKDSPYVANICLKFCKSAANTGIKKRIISINKFNDIDPIKLPKPDKHHLTIEQIKTMLNMAKDECKKYYVLFYVFVGTGMREGEIFALNVDDFNYQDKYFSVTKQFTHNELKNTPKTDSSFRKVYIFDDLAEVVKDYIKDVEGKILFPNMKGGYINANNFRKGFWKRIKKRAGITDRIRLHDLRGSYIDMILSSGLSPKFAQNNVGHSRIQTTLDIYAQNNADMVEQATTKINNIFNDCYKNVIKKVDNKKSNILPFRKKSDISSF